MPRRPNRRPRARRTLFALGLAALALAAAGSGPRAVAAPPPRWEYRVAVAPDLASLRVRLCFRDFVPRRLWLVGGGPLRGVHVVAATGMTLTPDPTDGSALRVGGAVGDPCVDYTVELAPLVEAGLCDRCGSDVITRPASWLLRAGFLPPDLDAVVTFDLPAGTSVAAPWPRLGAGPAYRVDPSTFPFIGHVAFGRFTSDRFVAAGCPVEVARLDGPLSASRDGIRRWISAAIEADGLLYGGRFPADRLLVVVRPSEGGGDLVPFGSTWYGGGPHAILYLGERAEDASLPGEWVAVHELLHATQPSIAQEDAWLSEGFATYYQEVVRARAGMQTAAQAWNEIERGFERGRHDRGDLPIGETSRRMMQRHAFHRVYWAGAAVALLLDVELRRTSGGRLSLDDVMRWIRETPGAGQAPLRAADVVAWVDRRLGAPRFQPMVEPILASAAFPDVRAAQAWLGIDASKSPVALLPGAPGAAARDAIMARPASRASAPASPR